MRKLRIMSVIPVLLLLLCACGSDWPGYAGTMEDYEYCHTGERDRAWEEDILFLAEKFLTGHPMLADDDFYHRTFHGLFGEEEVIYSDIMFDAQRRSDFLAGINTLIPRIPALSDTEVIYETQRIVAGLGDLHSVIWLSGGEQFPVRLEPFYDDAGVSLYAVSVPAAHEQILFGKLTAINGVAIETVMEQMRPYISCENEYAVVGSMASYYRLLIHKEAMHALHIMEEEADSALFTFETDSGSITVTLEALTSAERDQVEMLDFSPSKTYTMSYRNDENYWYEWTADHVLYVRFRAMADVEGLSVDSFVVQLSSLLRDAQEPPRVVIDFRDNSGGYLFYDEWKRFVSALERHEAEEVYILIDDTSYSAAVSTPYLLREAIGSAQLVGTPAGQPVNFYSNAARYTMPNSGWGFGVSSQYKWYMEGDCGTALMPDIPVWPTIEDYKNGVDTVLEYVLNIE